MCIAGVLKPRRTDWKFHAFLFTQFSVFTFGSEVLSMVGYNFQTRTVTKNLVRFAIWFAVYMVGLRIRSSIARLSNEELSEFISMSVVKGGMIVGFGQISFLAFSSIQCLSEAKVEAEKDGFNWNENSWLLCKRSLFSQTGLGCLVASYTIITLITGMAPKKYIERHTVDIKKIVTMSLTLEETVVVIGLTIAGGCGLFLLGNYGVQGNFRNDAEEYFFVSVMAMGTLSLLVTAVWKGLVIR